MKKEKRENEKKKRSQREKKRGKEKGGLELDFQPSLYSGAESNPLLKKKDKGFVGPSVDPTTWAEFGFQAQ